MGHTFPQAALFEKVLFLTAKLLIDQVIGLADQADGDVGDSFWWAGLDKLAVIIVALRCFAAKFADIARRRRVLVPDRQVTGTEIVALNQKTT